MGYVAKLKLDVLGQINGQILAVPKGRGFEIVLFLKKCKKENHFIDILK